MGRRTPTTCPRCRRQWSSYRQAHCAQCHTHFAGVGAFDQHFTPGGGCGDPADRGLSRSDRAEGPLWTTGTGHTPTPPPLPPRPR